MNMMRAGQKGLGIVGASGAFATGAAAVAIAVAILAACPTAALAAKGVAATTDDGDASPAVVRQAVERALSVPGARLASVVDERAAARAADCHPASAEVLRPVDGSGRIAVKLSGHSAHGKSCDAWTWVRVRVMAPVAVATRALSAGDKLEGATTVEERELRPGHVPARIGSASVVTHALGAGQIIEASLVSEPTLRPGEPIKVLVISGALMIEQTGRGAPCARGRSCAVLGSGKQVEGELVGGKLVVQSQ
jgi:flagella basal body P-ring formation protein FlgA